MNYLEGVPFKTPLGSLAEPLEEVDPVTAPEITVPDYLQILRSTEYEFTMENWILTGLRSGCLREQRAPHPPCGGESASCPPYWLMFSSPQERHLANLKSSELWAPVLRPRSHSLSSADIHHRQRSIWLISSDSEHEAGYSEDDEGSSGEENRPHPSLCERLRGTAPKHPLSRLKDVHRDPSSHRSNPVSPRGLGLHKRASLSTLQDSMQTSLSALEPSYSSSPQAHSQRLSRRRHLQFSKERKNSLPLKLRCSCPCLCSPHSRPQRPRPSSAGPIVKNHSNKAPWPRTSHGLVLDSSSELLSALSQKERELLEVITRQGYHLRTAILALQKTGYSSPEKETGSSILVLCPQIINYLVASEWLCELGYDETQVEEALEMFQNCESKAAEFLRLLTQFNEMGFQQSAIKEVLLIHENHRERALEELMTRVA
ncbi:ubiquitin-associated protein 1-like isoform X1 [Osmerus eperlanus]|uniref:ubiquitin-associated protein 1-like isoform X1 n=1 Tax=Osmerus eperlanus TaxID=29151 RepID=UPI002E1281B3